MSPQDRDSGAQPNAKGAPARSARSRTSDLEQLQLARELISRWMGLLRAARLYDCENDAVTQAAAAVLEISRRLGGADQGRSAGVQRLSRVHRHAAMPGLGGPLRGSGHHA